MIFSTGYVRNSLRINMRTTSLKTLLVLICLGGMIPATTVNAKDPGDIHDRAGTSAFPFLKINVGARAVAMGGAFTGLADDQSALYYNPAGMVSFEEKVYILGYHNYFTDMQSGFGGYITQWKENLFVGGYISYLNFGNFIGANSLGQETGDFSGGDLLVGSSIAYRLSHTYMVGGTLKLMYESIQEYSATGFAVDLGFKYSTNRERYNAGIAIQNLGKQLSALGTEKNRLPFTIRAGGSIRPKGMPLILVADVVKPIDNDMYLAVGGEYANFEPFYLRLGWNSFGTNFRAAESDDKWAGLALGVGFDIKKMQISYAFAPGAELGESHRITLTGRL